MRVSTDSPSFDQSAMRKSNLALVLRSVLRHPQSRAQLATQTQLTKGAVGGLVDELVQRGLVAIGDELVPTAMGRPGRLVRPVADRSHTVGLSFSVVYLVGVVVDLAGEIRFREQLPLDWENTSAEALVQSAVDLADSLIDRAKTAMPHSMLVGVGIGVPDLVDASAGSVRRSPTTGLRDYPLPSIIQSRLEAQVPAVFVDNDANFGALAELHVRADQNVRNLLYITGSYGVGGGIIAGHELFRGSGGFAGEVGHITVDPGGALCTCGSRGCLEAEVGLARFLARVGHLDARIDDRHTPVDDSISLVIAAAERGDALTRQAIDDVGRKLGIALGILINILNPDVVVLGGYFARIFPLLIPVLEASLRNHVMPELLAGCRIQASQLITHASALGAARYALDRLTDDPTVADRVTTPLSTHRSAAATRPPTPHSAEPAAPILRPEATSFRRATTAATELPRAWGHTR